MGPAQPEEWAYSVCFGPPDAGLAERVRVAGSRGSIEEGFEEAQGQVGLDPYEVRKWDGGYRHITLAMRAHAYLAVIRKPAHTPGRGKKKGTSEYDAALIPLTVPEVQRRLYRLIWQNRPTAPAVRAWSRGRRRHQARARLCHYQRRLALYLRL